MLVFDLTDLLLRFVGFFAPAQLRVPHLFSEIEQLMIKRVK